MKTHYLALFMAAAICHTPDSVAQAEPAQPAPAAGYERLAPLIGRWTVKGRENNFVETCRWYEGNFHVVCETESMRADGTTSHGMSIVGYVADEDRYVYLGIGSKGRTETMSGTFRDGIFEFTSESTSGGRRVVSRVRMGPFAGREIPFVAESSIDGAAWTTDASITYVRLD